MPRTQAQKHVYSLVLSDEIVEQVDRLAYQSGTSRSGMINQILAEYVSCSTPEQRVHAMFDEIQELLTGTGFQLLMKPSDYMLSLRQALNYKYNPTVRYSIELSQDGGEPCLRLKVLLRSQNQTLIAYLDQFFRLWQNFEKKIGGLSGEEWSIEPARYIRTLCVPEEQVSEENFGQEIAAYLQAVDEAMNVYFQNLEEPDTAVGKTRTVYQTYYDHASLHI